MQQLAARGDAGILWIYELNFGFATRFATHARAAISYLLLYRTDDFKRLKTQLDAEARKRLSASKSNHIIHEFCSGEGEGEAGRCCDADYLHANIRQGSLELADAKDKKRLGV